MSNNLQLKGVTSDGKLVVAGVYRFFETHGVQLCDIIKALYDKGIVPCWVSLAREMIAAGRTVDRTIETIISAVEDSNAFSTTSLEVIKSILQSQEFRNRI